MDESPMSIRILRTIENIINTDLLLEDFTIIPTEDNTKNKSPVIYEDHHLGLESWSVKYVYQHVCSELFKVRPLLAKSKIPYSKLQDLNHLLIGGLFINPDVTTFWNMRRELVNNDIVSIENELNFSKLVLTRKAKSLESFSYRRWLLNKIVEKVTRNNVLPSDSLLSNEFAITYRAAEASQNNYHAWTHRIWSWENLAEFYNTNQLIITELNFSEQWLERHVSDHSGFHYREYLLDLVQKYKFPSEMFHQRYYSVITAKLGVINDSESKHFVQFLLGKRNSKNSLDELLNYVTMLLYDLYVVVEQINSNFAGHESVWYFRRYLVFNLIKLSYKYHSIEFKNGCKNVAGFSSRKEQYDSDSNGLKQPKLFKNQLNKVEVSNLYGFLLEGERKFISRNAADSVQTDLGRQYVKWLSLVLEIDL